MSRARSDKREKAFEMWKNSGGKMMLKDIAAALNISPDQVRQWKRKDRWCDRLNTNNHVTNENDSVINHAKKKGGAPKGNRNAAGHGAPKGNKNALGNRGGHGGPPGNKKAEKHGFFSRIFPQDEETLAIIDEIQIKSPLDMLWENIVIQYMAIARSQKIMWVKDQEDRTEVLKRERRGRNPEKEWELQHAWDKHATFLQAQSRAIQTLERLIARYEELLLKDLQTEEKQMRIDKLKADIARITGGGDEQTEDDGFMEALQDSVKEVWANEEV